MQYICDSLYVCVCVYLYIQYMGYLYLVLKCYICPETLSLSLSPKKLNITFDLYLKDYCCVEIITCTCTCSIFWRLFLSVHLAILRREEAQSDS